MYRIVPGEMYYLGVFMVGAYQDIMGDLHNLFGRVTEAHIFLDPDEESGWYIEEVIEGSTIGEVLGERPSAGPVTAECASHPALLLPDPPVKPSLRAASS